MGTGHTTPGGQPALTLQQAAQRLADGGVVAFPTETVYGLGARADDDAAVAQIFALKGRPSEHPLIVHVATVGQAQAFSAEWPVVAQRLAQAFWPGPLTLIVPRVPEVAKAAAGGQASIGLRCPAHPQALALLQAAQALGVPGVAGPSANRFGRVSPTTAAHVQAEFGHAVPVLDGGACEVGIESAIVDCTRLGTVGPVLLRPGALTLAQLSQAAGESVHLPVLSSGAVPASQAAPRASGTLEAHYAPRAKVRLMTREALTAALGVLREAHQSAKPSPGAQPRIAVYARARVGDAGPSVRWWPMPDRSAQAAHDLFADLRAMDDSGVSLIWVESPPDTPDWAGVTDRLTRAAA
jgi:L-threonylcarbamoyladenylate synthase